MCVHPVIDMNAALKVCICRALCARRQPSSQLAHCRPQQGSAVTLPYVQRTRMHPKRRKLTRAKCMPVH